MLKIIQSIADIEELKARNNLPLAYIRIIETQFIDWYEAEGSREGIRNFRLPGGSCIIHLENDQDSNMVLDQWMNIEFVEHENINQCQFFRVGVMSDHQMHLLFFLEGTIHPLLEKRLKNERGRYV